MVYLPISIQVRRRSDPRRAFSSMPDKPKRCCNSSNTACGPRPLLCQHDQGVKPQIRGFMDDLPGIAVLGGDDGFGGFLADLFKIASRPLQ